MDEYGKAKPSDNPVSAKAAKRSERSGERRSERRSESRDEQRRADNGERMSTANSRIMSPCARVSCSSGDVTRLPHGIVPDFAEFDFPNGVAKDGDRLTGEGEGTSGKPKVHGKRRPSAHRRCYTCCTPLAPR